MKRLAFITTIPMLLTGCMTTTNYQQLTSGQTGCAPKDVLISDVNSSRSIYNWNAKCNDQKYYCTYVDHRGSSQAACHITE